MIIKFLSMIYILHPKATEKWRRGKVSMCLGALAYEVTIDGHFLVCKAHVDHMWPCFDDKIDVNDTVTSVTDSTN